jgi:hypothetical protein
MRVPGVDPQPLCPADLAISIKKSTHPSSLFFPHPFAWIQGTALIRLRTAIGKLCFPLRQSLPIPPSQFSRYGALNFFNKQRDSFLYAVANYLVCEYFFDILLQGYIDGLEAFHNRSKNNPSPIVHGVRQKRPSTQKWEISLKVARDALGLAREANLMAQRLQEETSERDDSNKRP